MENTSDDEMERLQGFINDLISVVSLPALLSDREPSEIIRETLDAFSRILRLDFAYARMGDPIDGAPMELLSMPQRRKRRLQPRDVGSVLEPFWTGGLPIAYAVI